MPHSESFIYNRFRISLRSRVNIILSVEITGRTDQVRIKEDAHFLGESS